MAYSYCPMTSLSELLPRNDPTGLNMNAPTMFLFPIPVWLARIPVNAWEDALPFPAQENLEVLLGPIRTVHGNFPEWGS